MSKNKIRADVNIGGEKSQMTLNSMKEELLLQKPQGLKISCAVSTHALFYLSRYHVLVVNE